MLNHTPASLEALVTRCAERKKIVPQIQADKIRIGGESPFRRLAALIAGIEPGAAPIDLSIGEPKHAVPDFVAPILAREIAGFGRYPPIKGSDAFRNAIATWLDERYQLDGLIDPESGVLPLSGSREGLFLAAFAARDHKLEMHDRPAILLPNPFYHAYAAAAQALGVEPVFFDVSPETDFLPDPENLDHDLLDRAIAVYVASPTAPQGTVASRHFWQRMIDLARQHDFMLFADECYSEIYRDIPPPGALEAVAGLDGTLDNLVVFNSLSKRSNLPGLRVGFAAGDPDFLTEWARFRNMAGPQVPLPIQAVGVAAFRDETHVAENRRLYNEKFISAEQILGRRFGAYTPDGGFFLWLDMSAVGGGEIAARRLWQEAGVRAVPGGYLAGSSPNGGNPGEDYLRVALVESRQRTDEALNRLVSIFT